MRWGVIGAGTIVTQFLNDTKQLEDVQIAAVYSRSPEKTKAFAEKYGIEKACASVDEMLQDTSIDNIYIGIPNNLHLEYILRCAAAKKNILCEKPIGINRKQVDQMLEAAKANGVLLMEGMWTRFFPLMKVLRQWLTDGTLGRLRAADISLGYNAIYAGEQATWRFKPESGFGALMDMGVYGVHFALDLLGDEETPKVQGVATVINGLDYFNSYTLQAGDKIVSVSSSIVNDTDLTAKIYTDKGELVIGAPWWYPKEMTFSRIGGGVEKFEFSRQADGLQYEVIDFEECVREKQLECRLSSHENTRRAIDIMDELRRQWGVRYPQDDM